MGGACGVPHRCSKSERTTFVAVKTRRSPVCHHVRLFLALMFVTYQVWFVTPLVTSHTKRHLKLFLRNYLPSETGFVTQHDIVNNKNKIYGHKEG
jgi:hypothetical protein